MSQLAALGFESQLWTPSDLNRYLRQVLEADYRLQDVWVAGELSNLARPASGHLYFNLKDAAATLRCVMWRSEAEALIRLPQEGEAVEVHGHLSVYEAGGQYQLYADQLRPAGEGLLYQQFLRLKQRLEQEGLFDPQRKRPLPAWPRRVGVVTSPTGAALQDVINVLRRRYPLVELILAPTPVQGEAAPAGIVAALQALNLVSRPEAILLVRGGGSIEDLWAFNDEGVVRAVVDSAAPLVTGIGHETDVILADFAADQRAPTPSAAAELVTPDRQELELELLELRRALGRAWERSRHRLRAGLQQQLAALRLLSPHAGVANARQRVDELLHQARAQVRRGLDLRRADLTGLTQTLRAVGPQAVLDRGYALVSRGSDGQIVRSIKQVSAGLELSVRVSDGSFGARAQAASGKAGSSAGGAK